MRCDAHIHSRQMSADRKLNASLVYDYICITIHQCLTLEAVICKCFAHVTSHNIQTSCFWSYTLFMS